jgi:hypothetical protein
MKNQSFCLFLTPAPLFMQQVLGMNSSTRNIIAINTYIGVIFLQMIWMLVLFLGVPACYRMYSYSLFTFFEMDLSLALTLKTILFPIYGFFTVLAFFFKFGVHFGFIFAILFCLFLFTSSIMGFGTNHKAVTKS